MNEEKKKLTPEEFDAALEQISKTFRDVMDEIEDESEKYWNSLSKEDQLKVFCAISRRIYKGEIEERGTYRYVLYNVFGFGPEAYAPAQCANYLEIHNSLYGGVTFNKMERVNRIEVIDAEGRSYSKHLSDGERVEYHLQDDDKTLKIFISAIRSLIKKMENQNDPAL